MSDGTRSPYLGEHVVGQRIVVRRLVPGETGPTGGPAFVDVLGECIAWDPCVVLTAARERVTIPVQLIVSGKPVPPRPSTRLRATVAETEALVAGLWPSVQTTEVAGWTLRYSPTAERRRANSCLALTPPTVPLVDALAEVVRCYAGLGREPLLAVDRDGDLVAAAVTAGWGWAGGDSTLMLAGTARVLRLLRGMTRVDTDAIEAAVETAGMQAVATVVRDGTVVARGRGVLAGEWLGLHELYVDPAARRAGLGRAVVAALVEWGAEQGARTAWLHVEDDNVPARTLYEAAGFAEHHRMGYLAPR